MSNPQFNGFRAPAAGEPETYIGIPIDKWRNSIGQDFPSSMLPSQPAPLLSPSQPFTLQPSQNNHATKAMSTNNNSDNSYIDCDSDSDSSSASNVSVSVMAQAAFDSVHESAATLQRQVAAAERRYEKSVMKANGHKAQLLRLRAELQHTFQKLDRYLDVIDQSYVNGADQAASMLHAHRAQYSSRAWHDNVPVDHEGRLSENYSRVSRVLSAA